MGEKLDGFGRVGFEQKWDEYLVTLNNDSSLIRKEEEEEESTSSNPT